jgi:hypothetical protein
MKVTVVFEDSLILVDLIPKSNFVFQDVDPNWRVIQWQDDRGWVEVHRGERLWISDFSFVEPYVELWNSVTSEG